MVPPFDPSVYPKLYEFLGYAQTPDFRGFFLRMLDHSGTVDPEGATRTIGSLQGDEFKAHSHEYNTKMAELPQTGFTTNCWVGNQSAATSLTGGAETRPVNIAISYMIKAK